MKEKQNKGFKPQNKYPSLNELVSKDLSKQEVLEKNNLIKPALNIDKSVFQKTEEEKQLLKRMKKQSKQEDARSKERV